MLLIRKLFAFHAYICSDLIFTRMKELDKCIELNASICVKSVITRRYKTYFISVTIINTVPQIVPEAPDCDTCI